MDQREHRRRSQGQGEFAGRIATLQVQVKRGKLRHFRDKEKKYPRGCSQEGWQVKATYMMLLVVNILCGDKIQFSAFAFLCLVNLNEI